MCPRSWKCHILIYNILINISHFISFQQVFISQLFPHGFFFPLFQLDLYLKITSHLAIFRKAYFFTIWLKITYVIFKHTEIQLHIRWNYNLDPALSHYLFFFFSFVFCLLRSTPTAYGDSQARGQIRGIAAGLRHSHSNQIWATSVTYTTAHGNARSLTHWVRPGIESETSCFLVGFISAVPRWELLSPYLKSLSLYTFTFWSWAI